MSRNKKVISIIIYVESGEIIRCCSTPEDMALSQLQEGEFMLVGCADDVTQYIENNAVKDKSDNSISIDKSTVIADGLDAVSISNIPANSQINIEGNGVNIVQPVFQSESITFDLSGEYLITIKTFPFLDYQVLINAN